MGTRDNSDEAYVVGLCNRILGERALTQHRFAWLLGDPGVGGRQVKLPVDAYWPEHRLVLEYRELQHEQAIPHFDKPERLTVSGVHRGEQRALYDARRDREIPAHGLRLVVVRPADLDADSRGRLRRTARTDLTALAALLAHVSEASSAGPAEPAHPCTQAGDEARVTEAFRTWLLSEGWTPVVPTDRWTDLEAVRGAERLICEAKGHTSDKGTDADIAYGQLLRRMTLRDRHTRYALAVPTSSLEAAARVPAHVRRLLRVDVYEVTDDDQVRRLADED